MPYSISERKQLSKTFAKASEINAYRSLLKNKGSRLATILDSNKDRLAKTLYYELLGYYCIEDIENCASPEPAEGEPPKVPVFSSMAKDLKKKLTNTISTLISTGKTWITRK